MPRKKLIRSNDFPYHVFNKSLDGVFYPEEKFRAIWDLGCDLLKICTWAYGARIHAFVLMSNHYHLLLSTPDSNLDDCIGYFQSNFAQSLSEMSGKQALCFGTRYKWSLIRNPRYFHSVYRYVYQNPIRAGLVNRAERYRWSTLVGRLGLCKLEVPICPSSAFGEFIPADLDEELSWINEPIPTEKIEEIRFGLKKSCFAVPGYRQKVNTERKRGGAVGKSALAPFLEEGAV